MTTKNNVICSDRDIMGGTPAFRRTRVPIKNLINYTDPHWQNLFTFN
ncbi:MAG: DUF433 domain-containing protein [Waterburya sp.]